MVSKESISKKWKSSMTTDTAPNILAIDTAASVFSVALGTATGQWYFEANAGTRHSELLMEITDFLFKKAGLKPTDLSLVVCMNGPGSFTGLRIGFSCAKGLALALGIPFAAISSLECMAYPYSMWPGLVMPVIDAKKNAWFCALFSGATRITEDMDADLETICAAIAAAEKPAEKPLRLLLAGPDAAELQIVLKNSPLCENTVFFTAPSCRTGSARELLAIAKSRKIVNNISSNFDLGPDYIRKSDAEIKTGNSG